MCVFNVCPTHASQPMTKKHCWLDKIIGGEVVRTKSTAIVTVLAVPKGVTLNGQPCNTFTLANQLQFMDNMDLKESETSPSWLLTFIDPKDSFLDLMLS